jgi:hypothetical protein
MQLTEDLNAVEIRVEQYLYGIKASYLRLAKDRLFFKE